MRLGFFLPRRNHLKILGSVAVEARHRGHTVWAIVRPEGLKGDTSEEWARGTGLFDWVSPYYREPDWIVAVGLRTAPYERQVSRPLGMKWAALDSCGDNLTFLLEGDSTGNWDLVTTLSEEAKQFAVAETGGYFGNDLVPIGYPELDQLSLQTMTREACRAKWNLPAGQMVVLFGTAARPIRLGRIRRWWFGQVRYRQIVRALRQWCDERGALLIAKTRAKHGDPAWLARICDRVVGDESFYPFSTLELLQAADLYVGFASAMAIEACAVGIPQVHLHGWPPERYEWPSAWPMKQRFFLERDGLWNTSFSSQVACYAPSWAGRMRFHLSVVGDGVTGPGHRNGSAAQGRAYARWAGPLDGKASSRFLDLLEIRCGG